MARGLDASDHVGFGIEIALEVMTEQRGPRAGGRTRHRGLGLAGAVLGGIVAYDLAQRRHAILRNFPIAGHFRYLLEALGPELRQYIVTSNNDERPFSRDQRRWVEASSRRERNTFGFGTDDEVEAVDNLLIVKHSPFPAAAPGEGEPGGPPDYGLPAGKVLGGAHGRARAFRPESVVNISGMSYGALSEPAVEAMNRGAAASGCLHNTGEGGLAPPHRHGGHLVFQIGTGYFGCRNERGGFSLGKLSERLDEAPVRALEVKLSQGAKPGLGGLLPARKVSREIAAIRGVAPDEDCVSPPAHSAFRNVEELIEFVEMLAAETGLPVGIKSAVGEGDFWEELADRMSATGGGPDFISVDGGEGGTGAGPLAFSDHVALPFKVGFARVYSTFARAALADDIVFIGAGRLGFPDSAPVRLRTRLRHGQRRPRGDARGGLHPGDALPHRPLSDRCRHPVALVDARPRPAGQVPSGGQLRRDSPRRAPSPRALVRRRSPGPRDPGPHRDRRRALQRHARGRRVRLRIRLAPPLRSPTGRNRIALPRLAAAPICGPAGRATVATATPVISAPRRPVRRAQLGSGSALGVSGA